MGEAMRHLDRAICAGLGLFLIVAAAPPPPPQPELPPKAIYMDPPIDAAHPAQTMALEIESGGSVLNSVLYLPSGTGPFPLVVLAHGLPGNEDNRDLAQAMRRAGWAVLTYHYRGAFGSEGYFTIDNTLADMDTVIAQAKKSAQAWNVDPKRIVAMGHSMGGLAAAHATEGAPDLLGTALIAPWDPSVLKGLMAGLSAQERDRSAKDRWSDVSHGRLAGATTPAIAETIATKGETWKLVDHAPALAKKPLLVVTAKNDLASAQATQLLPALTAAGAKPQTVELETNHTFDDKRIALQIAVLKWLATLPGAPPAF